MVSRRLMTFASLLALIALVMACTPAPQPDQAVVPTPTAAAGQPAEPTDAEDTPEPTMATEPTGPAADGSTRPATTGEPYRIGIFSDLTTTNYWSYLGPNTSTWNSYVLGPQGAALYGLADKTFALVPVIATDLPERPLVQEGEFFVSEIRMKEGITWTDGTPLTARDVAFTANTALQLRLTGNWGSIFDPTFLDRVEAVDDYTVRYYYRDDPGLAVHEYGALVGPIMSEAYWSPVVEQARTAVGGIRPPAENATEEEQEAYQRQLSEALNELYSHNPQDEPKIGPFTFARWERGAFAENTANDDYFFSGAEVTVFEEGYRDVKPGGYETVVGDTDGEPLVTYTVGPFVPAVIYTIYGDQNAALLALQQGEIDFMLNPSGLQRGLQTQIERQVGLNVIENPTNGFRYLSFNTRREPMGDRAFRQAVATLIDKEFVTQQILQGVASPIYSFIPQGNAFWYTDDVPKFGLHKDGTPMTREERVEAAIAILEEAGYSWEGGVRPTWDSDNRQVVRGGTLVLPSGETMTELELLAPGPGYDPLRSTFAIWIEQYLNEFGIPVRANLTGFNIILERVNNQQDFDMFMLGWSLTIFPDYVRDFFHSDRAGLGDFNAGGFSNPEFDELADEIKVCKSFDECREISVRIQQVLAEELPYVVLFDTNIIEVYADYLQFPYTETLDGLQNLYGMPSIVTIE